MSMTNSATSPVKMSVEAVARRPARGTPPLETVHCGAGPSNSRTQSCNPLESRRSALERMKLEVEVPRDEFDVRRLIAVGKARVHGRQGLRGDDRTGDRTREPRTRRGPASRRRRRARSRRRCPWGSIDGELHRGVEPLGQLVVGEPAGLEHPVRVPVPCGCAHRAIRTDQRGLGGRRLTPRERRRRLVVVGAVEDAPRAPRGRALARSPTPPPPAWPRWRRRTRSIVSVEERGHPEVITEHPKRTSRP